jgi:iron(III) transport system permease protein
MALTLLAHWRRAARSLPWGWAALALGLVLLATVPLASVPLRAVGPAGEHWSHVATTLLPGYLGNTAFLLAVSGGVALALGVGAAWLVALCEFPGRRIFRWALVLPLGMPAYMAAYVYAGMADVTGPIQRLVRALVPGARDAFLHWNVMRIEVVAVLFGVVLFPYVYLPTRALLEHRAGPTLEAARLLGHGAFSVFWRVALPLARPAIAGGLALVLMEVLNDYGAVKYYGVATFTTGIFRAWFTLGDLDTAVRLAGILMLLVMTLLLAERWQRGGARYHGVGGKSGAARYRLRGVGAAGAIAFCAAPLALGFAVPVLQLLAWAWRTGPAVVDARFLQLAINSMGLAAVAGAAAVAVAIPLAFAARIDRTPLIRSLARVALLGYSVPGAVIAVGVLTTSLAVDRLLTGGGTLVLTGTVAALVFAYLIRFMAVAYLPVEAGLEKIGDSLTSASRTLGASPLSTLLRVELPLLKGSILAAATLVVIDVLKELPLTLILRPFNLDTLATRAFQLATDEQVPESAPAALLVIGFASLVVAVLHRTLDRRERAS